MDAFKTIKVTQSGFGWTLQQSLVGAVQVSGGVADAGKIVVLSATGQIDPSILPGGGVTSVFGRTGTVIAEYGDYSFSLISGQLSASDLSNGTTGTGPIVLLNSPSLSGVPLAPTANPGTNTSQIATTAFVLANTSAVPITTVKRGSGLGDYETTSTSFVDVDPSNLTFTIIVPVGWKLIVRASGTCYALPGNVVKIALYDLVPATQLQSVASGYQHGSTDLSTDLQTPFSLDSVITGDGASHTILLQYASPSGSQVFVGNNSALESAVMTFFLTPSN